ncbi:hypothetical protein [Acanthopleuribacter pedis]|uniref:Uncharacterized protein n=1 Tax=Acanthopleuribacter pedis TaxID=442870 RepID=A0A8J7U1R1_9BACT|nr:hypothetical protein [Acanthopleuribacter pedis]MBO1317792.1 hypothetical protein [Acanthopleuribacter pedis]
MLLCLDPSLVVAAGQENVPNEIRDALENIALAIYEGSHLVVGDRSVLGTLAKLPQLSERARSCFQYQHGQMTQLGNLINHFSYRIEITAHGPAEIRNQGRVGTLPASWFAHSSVIQHTIFLCEHLDDEALFKKIGEVYKHKKGLARLALHTEPQMGGGSTTGTAYQHIQDQQKRLCFCLVDSDRKHPKGALGDTAKAVKNADDLSQPLCGYAVLDVREGENLIPNAVFTQARGADPHQGPALQFLDELQQSGASDCRAYLDMKDGLNYGKVAHEPPQSEFRHYWQQQCQSLPGSKIKNHCTINPGCKDPKHCECLLFAGLGPQILRDSVAGMNKLKPARLYNMLDQNLQAEWLRIGALMAAWFCASYPKRAT